MDAPSDNALCGHTVKGNINVLCARKVGHKGFHQSKAARDNDRIKQAAYYQNHKEYLDKVNRQWVLDNRDRDRHNHRAWAASNSDAVKRIRRRSKTRRRARVNGVPHVDWTRELLIDLYGTACWLCGQELSDDWHADHVVPVSQGGWDVPTNLRPSCPQCNWKKHDRLVGNPVVVLWSIWSMTILPVRLTRLQICAKL